MLLGHITLVALLDQDLVTYGDYLVRFQRRASSLALRYCLLLNEFSDINFIHKRALTEVATLHSSREFIDFGPQDLVYVLQVVNGKYFSCKPALLLPQSADLLGVGLQLLVCQSTVFQC